MLISVFKLNELFSRRPHEQRLIVDTTCCDCGARVGIEICRTGGGYGFTGGVLYEYHEDRLVSKCAGCYQKNPTLLDNACLLTADDPKPLHI